jgi:hypothetical protein
MSLLSWIRETLTVADRPLLPPSTKVHGHLVEVEIPPVQPPAINVESLPVSCLVKGIVKSIESGERWHFIPTGYSKATRVHTERGLSIYYPTQYYSGTCTPMLPRLLDCNLPENTSTGHFFNVREARMVEDAFVAREKLEAEKAQRELDLKKLAWKNV